MRIHGQILSVAIIACLGFLLFPNPLMAQPYERFLGVDTTRWNIDWCNLDQGGLVTKIAIGDTIVNGINYKKVGRLDNGVFHFQLSPYSGNGLVREDTTLGKAWFLSITHLSNGQDSLVERLVLDLSLEVADTFVVFGPAVYRVGDPFGVDSLHLIVDSIYFSAGQKHLRFQPAGGQMNLLFIEGVGSNLGWAYMHDELNLCPCLNDYRRDTLLVYEDSTCKGIFSAINPFANPLGPIELSPHPIRDRSELRFENPAQKLIRLEVFDLWGRKIDTQTSRKTYFEIENHTKSTGLYAYMLILKGKIVHSGKMMFTK